MNKEKMFFGGIIEDNEVNVFTKIFKDSFPTNEDIEEQAKKLPAKINKQEAYMAGAGAVKYSHKVAKLFRTLIEQEFEVLNSIKLTEKEKKFIISIITEYQPDSPTGKSILKKIS